MNLSEPLPDTFNGYALDGFFDEMFTAQGGLRPHYQRFASSLGSVPRDEWDHRRKAVDTLFLRQGITFNVYGDSKGTERIFPFDLMPRIISSAEWERLEAGLVQRITALNLFLHDIYHEQRILKDGVIPPYYVLSAQAFSARVRQFPGPRRHLHPHLRDRPHPRRRRRVHGAGGQRPLPIRRELCAGESPRDEAHLSRRSSKPRGCDRSTITPPNCSRCSGTSRRRASATQRSCCSHQARTTPLISSTPTSRGRWASRSWKDGDLTVRNQHVFMRTTKGLRPVHVIYRRIDDDFLDPTVFRPDSALGVPGLVHAYRAGTVSLANSIGTGIADDKVMYYFVPRIIKYYLDQEPLIKNVPTYLASEDADRKYIVENLDKLVVKAANEAGGYGMLMGPHATHAEREEFRQRIEADPRNYIAQPMISLSRHPTFINDSGQVEGRHIDLRPYILYGKKTTIIPGGLTRVALRRGSLVVNSSQGGGSKDTWVLYGED
jgi:uncharacterized circularly permuted ATP-grasp superfamily protein